jgi:hypothetical protein
MPITFDAEEITGKLDAIRLTQLPFAASRAANQLGWELKNSSWPAFARRTFTASGPPVPFTTGGGGVTGGLLYKHNRGEPRGSTPTKTPSGNRSRSKFTGYRFFSVPEARGSLKPGIYRAKGRGELQQLFSYLDSVPTVPSIWSFEEFAERESLPILERILPQFIEEALK